MKQSISASPSSPIDRNRRLLRVALRALATCLVLSGSASHSWAEQAGVADAPSAHDFGRVGDLIGQAERLRLMERFDEARSLLERADGLASSDAERALNSLARGLLLSQTEDPFARVALDEALAAATSIDLAPVAAIAAIELTKLAAASGDREAARRYADLAQSDLAGTTRAIRTAAQLAEAVYLASFADQKQAAAAVDRVLSGGELDANRTEDGRLLIEAGRLARRAGDIQLAKRAFEDAGRSDNAHLAALGHDELADLLEAQGDLLGALERSSASMSEAQAVGSSNLIFRSAWRRGRLLAALGDSEAALAAYQIAFGSLRALRISSSGTYLAGQSLYRLRYGAFHQSFVDFLTSTEGLTDDQRLLVEARNVIEDLKIDEVEDYFQERCVDTSQVAVQITEVASDTAVIYPIILPDRIEVLVERGGRISRSTTRMTEVETERLVKLARIDLEVYGRPFMTRSAQVYDIIVRPFEAELRNASTIVFVPDGVFRLLPIAALWDGEQFLIERFAIATVLGMSLVEAGEVTSNATALVAGATSVEGFAPLPSVAREMSSIARTLRADALLEEDFDVERFGSALRSEPHGLIHIASHAQIGGRPSDNFIATTDGRVDMNLVALVLRARSLVTGVPLELLTLSACATASGDDRAPLGLAGIAFRAGARSVMASLWPVFDNATADLMIRFYDELTTGVGRAEALRRAQIALLSQDTSTRHPAVWAAFTIIGEWR